MKKHFAVFKYSDQKVIPLYATETIKGGVADIKDAPSPNDSFSKRFVDVTFSLLVLVFGLPFYLLVAAFIKLTSEGPVLFIQERVGKDGVPFKFYKFRTMTVDNSDSHHRDFTKEFIKGPGDGRPRPLGQAGVQDAPRSPGDLYRTLPATYQPG